MEKSHIELAEQVAARLPAGWDAEILRDPVLAVIKLSRGRVRINLVVLPGRNYIIGGNKKNFDPDDATGLHAPIGELARQVG